MQGSAAIAEGLQILISQNVPGTQVNTYKTTAVRVNAAVLFITVRSCLFLTDLARRNCWLRCNHLLLYGLAGARSLRI